MKIDQIEQKYCSQGDTSARHNPKKYFTNGQGSFLYDAAGTAFLDMQMCNSSANFGYQHPAFEGALLHQLKTLPSLSSEFMCDAQVLLAEKICTYMENRYGVKGRVHFSVGGAQAVDDALKMVAAYTGTRNVFTFEGSYHGRTMAASSISSSHRYHSQFGSVINTYRIPFPCCVRCPYEKNKEDCDLFCARRFEHLFESEYYGVYQPRQKESMYRAFVAEPLLGRCGYVVPPEGYFKRIAAFLHKYHIILMFDEIQMGFYRTGKMWAFENWGVVPDIFTFGKAISNGLWPLSGVWAREDMMSPKQWPIGSSHATFAGNPIAMSLGLTAMTLVGETAFKERVATSGKKLTKIIAALKSDYPIIGRTDCCGMAAGVEIVNRTTGRPDPNLAHKIADDALQKPISINGINYGLILSVGGLFENAFLLAPNLNIKEDELSLFNTLFRHYLDLSEG